MNICDVRERRDSLEGVAGAEKATVLVLNAPVGRWDGLERFRALKGLEVNRGCLPGGDASPIATLSSLRSLSLSFDAAPLGIDRLSALAGLESLSLWGYGGPASFPSELSWVGALRALDLVEVVNVEGRLVAEIELAALAQLPRLEELTLQGVVPREGAALFMSGFPVLRALRCTTTPDFDVDAIVARRPDLAVDGRPAGPAPAKPVILDHEAGFSVYLDLAASLPGDANNYDAVEILSERLVVVDPQLFSRLGWDPEADGTAVLARDRRDLERFLDLLAKHELV
jgi:hypothetical protein